MKKEMLVNVLQPEECRIAILEDGVLEELYLERSSIENFSGNIYRGKIVNIEPSIQAAFVDFGVGKNGFLHVSDVEYQYYKHLENGAPADRDRRGRAPKDDRRDKPPIQDIFKRGSEVLVQVIKESVGNKGPTLSTYISIPGRYLVLMPGLGRVGVSRKIEDESARRKLRGMLRELDPPDGLGFIIRTAGVDRSQQDLQRDLNYLVRLWKTIYKRLEASNGPGGIYEESDMMLRTIRDIFNTEIDAVYIDEEEAYERARDFMKVVMPKYADRVKHYTGKAPLFEKYNIEDEIIKIQSRNVPLKGGGSIVIDPTEALVAIDVNSGNTRADENAEANAYHVNLRAAEEIARQLRLRDLGGVIVNDFIDMREEKHRRGVERALRNALDRDRARTKVLRISPFGLVEMTRQRIRPSLRRSVYEDCPCCSGTGYVKTPESVAIDAIRAVLTVAHQKNVSTVSLEIHERVAHYLNNKKRREITDIEENRGVTVHIKSRTDVGPEHMIIRCEDENGREMRHLASVTSQGTH
ncbi:Rne/Rng family ribonuclease [Calycomorphotria hydatis]|uniref:Ribonuclease G n=1 Tax=Calycomorphotria hydatis TaxID=2528027 RepID=A0A517TF64_9PLAN|nr:Rne/Rng family ribonuclease [Calycomorphotria hydatis]QDT67016.1 Ribonuclease E [Calycomorphotria hydatis]